MCAKVLALLLDTSKFIKFLDEIFGASNVKKKALNQYVSWNYYLHMYVYVVEEENFFFLDLKTKLTETD